jgi:hypothetical protein
LAQVYADVLATVSGMPEGNPYDLTYLDELIGRSITLPLFLAAVDAFQLAPGG